MNQESLMQENSYEESRNSSSGESIQSQNESEHETNAIQTDMQSINSVNSESEVEVEFKHNNGGDHHKHDNHDKTRKHGKHQWEDAGNSSLGFSLVDQDNGKSLSSQTGGKHNVKSKARNKNTLFHKTVAGMPRHSDDALDINVNTDDDDFDHDRAASPAKKARAHATGNTKNQPVIKKANKTIS